MAFCTSKWWHGPVFFTISVILAFMAISTALRFTSTTDSSPIKPINDAISLNASRALRKSGFNIMATLLQVSPELFLSSPNSTIFAIQDSSISNSSFNPWLFKNLLQYHTTPYRLSMDDLLNEPQGTCLPTFYRKKNVAITKIDSNARFIEINHVLVSHPDIFLDGTISVHGVLGPFFPLYPQDTKQGLDFIQSPLCDSNSSLVSDILESKNLIDWSGIIQLLTSNGFLSFAIGLQAALDGILEDSVRLNSFTIFAPTSLAYIASPSPLLERVVRSHIIPQKITYEELASLPARTLLRTLVPDQDLEVTPGVAFMQGLAINGVEIVAPEIFHSEKFVIHGISQAFEMCEPPHRIVSD